MLQDVFHDLAWAAAICGFMSSIAFIISNGRVDLQTSRKLLWIAGCLWAAAFTSLTIWSIIK